MALLLMPAGYEHRERLSGSVDGVYDDAGSFMPPFRPCHSIPRRLRIYSNVPPFSAQSLNAHLAQRSADDVERISARELKELTEVFLSGGEVPRHVYPRRGGRLSTLE